MGVCGCGKSSVGGLLASTTGGAFIDAGALSAAGGQTRLMDYESMRRSGAHIGPSKEDLLPSLLRTLPLLVEQGQLPESPM